MPVDTISWIMSGTEDGYYGLNSELPRQLKKTPWNVETRKEILVNQWNVKLKTSETLGRPNALTKYQ